MIKNTSIFEILMLSPFLTHNLKKFNPVNKSESAPITPLEKQQVEKIQSKKTAHIKESICLKNKLSRAKTAMREFCTAQKLLFIKSKNMLLVNILVFIYLFFDIFVQCAVFSLF